MIKLYYGRDNLDKEKFIYDSIQGKALILVPDQYTLEAEKQAMKYLKTTCLMDIEVMSISRLADRVLEKEGGSRRTFIDKYGRHILLSKILREKGESLKVFGKVKDKTNFIEATNNFISQIKQYGLTSKELFQLAKDLNEGKLKEKLLDLAVITQGYEEATKDKYVDSEDKLNLFLEKISKYDELKDCQVWIYGFDSFAPKTLEVIKTIMEISPNTNVVMTWSDYTYDKELFELTGFVLDSLEEKAKALGKEVEREPVPESYERRINNEGIKHIEKNIYAMPYKKLRGEKGLQLVQAANPYNEAETAAAYILKLVREENLRFRDIMVVSNNQGVGWEIIRRVFSEYGIKLFVDKKRDILNSSIIIAIISLLNIVKNNYRTSDIMAYLKSEFSDLSIDEIEKLENYSYKYKIKGGMWKKPFKYGEEEYGQEEFHRIEILRQRAISAGTKLEAITKSAESIKDFAGEFCEFLDEIKLPQRIEELVEYQEENLGHLGHDVGQETKQIWGSFVNVLEQIALLLGEEDFGLEEFTKLLEAGMSGIQVGVLPPTADGVILGTTQRSRAGSVRATIVLTANDGIFPLSPSAGELFTADEMDRVLEEGKEIGKLDSVRIQEEKLAIYRTLTRPLDYLMVSWCLANSEGEAMRPSPIISKIQAILPDITQQLDILNQEGNQAQLELIAGKTNTLRHLTNKLQEATYTKELDPIWRETLLLYKDSKEIKDIRKGIGFTNEKQSIDKERIYNLFKIEEGKEFKISPSRLEKYSRCPFAHLINYGLRAEEKRIHELDARNIGNIYHDTFMEVFRELTKDGKKVSDPESRLMTISKEELDEMVSRFALLEVKKFDNAQFEIGKREEYRTNRLIDICKEVTWTLIEQARRGEIEDIQLEVAFDHGEKISPITVRLDDGQEICIYGRIDRVDTLPGDKVKIIDYKSGKEVFQIVEAKKGYRLQLMLYLKAAQANVKEPAGVFYFLIHEPMSEMDGNGETALEKIQDDNFKSYKMNGIMVDEDSTISALDKNIERTSKVIPYSRQKNGKEKNNFALSKEDFKGVQDVVDKKVEEFCKALVSGQIPLRPMKTKEDSACNKCAYQGICRFDTIFEGCQYEIVE